MVHSLNITINSVEVAEQSVRFRLPFRFGQSTLDEASQVFLRVSVSAAGGRTAQGLAASLLVPKWFDKTPDRADSLNIEHLRRALELAAQAYQSDKTRRTGFGHFALHYEQVLAAAAAEGINPLTAGFGPALLDAAIADATGRLAGLSFYELARQNLLGFDPAQVVADLDAFEIDAWLRMLRPNHLMAARHTIGLLDPIEALPEPHRSTRDGLPETLPDIIERYGHRHFKLKVSGDIRVDLARLEQIAAVLDQSPQEYLATLDGNEQFDEIEPLEQLWRQMEETPRLARLVRSIGFIEQPIRRAAAKRLSVCALARRKPLVIDESDDSLNAFTQARELGYSGVSSKLCKGLYKSLINAARCEAHNRQGGHLFMTAEDLSNQAGVAVQQDLALVSLIGLNHVERNGHHYVDGFAGSPPQVPESFQQDHGDLYSDESGATRLNIRGGQLPIRSLDCPGFALGYTAREALLSSLQTQFQSY
ncbi:MAG: enolase C-terminal domain-like protein [Burkholderiaceae bacterium]